MEMTLLSIQLAGSLLVFQFLQELRIAVKTQLNIYINKKTIIVMKPIDLNLLMVTRIFCIRY